MPIYPPRLLAVLAIRALTLILTGCRIGELLALEPDDIDWHGHAIIIKRAMKAGRIIGSTKGDETGRRVDMGPALASALREAGSGGERRSARGRQRQLVFPAPSGGYDDAKRLLEHEHRPALERAGLRTSIVTHEFRHTAAAVWLSSAFPSNTCGARWAIATSQRRSGTTATSSARSSLTQRPGRRLPSWATQNLW